MAEKVYFKNLQGFRFIAAVLVILSHIELFKKRVLLSNIWDSPFFFEAGSAGVDFFFVLSGFLITMLLLKEIEKTGRVNVRKFYMRRILRIWPLYYLIILISYFIVPHLSIFYIQGYTEGLNENFWGKFLFSLFFIPNVALAFFESIPYAAPLWSVGVEEQFYVFWPFLLSTFNRKIRSILIFIVVFVAAKVIFILINKMFHLDAEIAVKIKNLLVGIRMECMGIGGLGAYLIYRNHKVGCLIKSNILLLVAIILLPLVFLFAKNLFELHHIFFSLLFLVIIANGAVNKSTPIKLENKFFFMMGNISYGLYLWHSLCIGLIINALRANPSFLNNLFLFNLLLYVGVFGFSILVAWISYTFFETPFLRMKQRFSIIVSGAAAAGEEKK
ncbi:hypothetical protein DC498_11615 [Terrimonas sp.]|uniref:acyltransferase family protein n=1 Tax=Terrimonas sp. TaxID=1914338 RepID=UPI000D50B5DC|nr:acyltransferase [Terrimonas sp.]PVD52030.1 hypothetical protein DC498_11615 [Terrimonas sp.]